jgi:hypothetical protein
MQLHGCWFEPMKVEDEERHHLEWFLLGL